MNKRTLGTDILQKYKKYSNTHTKFKAYKMNQQIFDIDDTYEPQVVSTSTLTQWARVPMAWSWPHSIPPKTRWWASRKSSSPSRTRSSRKEPSGSSNC